MSRFVYLYCLSVLFLTFETKSSAQSYNLRHYTVSDGLPSNQVFGVLQSRTGEMYIGTEYGLVHFDGEDFRQIAFEESRYSGSTVLGMNLDPRKNLWIKTYRDGLFYIHTDTLRSFRGNDLLKVLIQASTIEQFAVDSSGNVWFTVGHVSDTIFRISSDGQQKKSFAVDQRIIRAGIKQFVFKVDEKSQLVCRTSSNFPVFKDWQEVKNENGFGLATSAAYASILQTRAGTFLSYGNKYYLSVGNLLVIKNIQSNPTDKITVNGEIHCLSSDIFNNILIGTKNGAYIYNTANSKLSTVFSGQQVHSICQDSEKGYWFATHNGLVYMPSLYMHTVEHQHLSGALNSIAGNDSVLVITGMDRRLHILKVKNDKVMYAYDFKRNLDMIIPKKTLIYEGKVMLGQSFFMLDEKREYSMLWGNSGEMLDIEKSETTGVLLFGYKRGFSLYHTNSRRKNQQETLKCKDLFCRAIYQSKGVYYLGTDHGLYTYRNNLEAVKYFPEQINCHVSDIKSAANGTTIIVSTRAAGVFVIKNGIIRQFSSPDGLSSPFCTQIYVENDSTFWIGSNKGLNRIHWNENHSYIDRWFTDDGLVSNKINELTRVGKFLFVLTDQGISYFEPQNLTTGWTSVRLELNELRIQGQKVVGKEIRLKPNQTDINFDFKVLGFKRGKNVQLSYLLTGKDQILSQTGGHTIMYSDLAPGKYMLEVKAHGLGNKQLGETLLYTIIVEPHFYETRLFWVICSIVLLLLIIGSIYLHFKRLEAIRKRKWEYGNAQLEALNLQINPHFLFNALNSIQYLSLSREHKILNKFISGLSGLLRSILRNSKSNLVPLSIEIENIKRYLELEIVRFEDEEFHYDLLVDEQLLNGKFKIPPMILQPIVENAIWHGLLPKKGEKRLYVSVKEINHGFSVIIEDNGEGINKSKEQKKVFPEELKSSLGLDNVMRRMHLYRSMGFGEAEIEVTDLSILGNGMSGTRVVFIFKLSETGNKT